MAALRLTSPAFDNDEDLPLAYTADGDDTSPPLEWQGVPEGTRELVLVAEDPDAEEGVVTYWTVYGLSPETRSLPEGLPRSVIVEDDDLSLVQGLNEFDDVGYAGPELDDERGPHRMFFRLFALGAELDLPPGATRAELRNAAKGHVLAQTELVGII